MSLRFPLILVAVCVISALSVSSQTKNIADIQSQAQAGNAKAQFDLARAFYDGAGVAKDPKQGLEWLKRSALQGYFAAEYGLGKMYQTGYEGATRNPHEAASWFRKAAAQKNEAAKTELKTMLAQGLISKQEASWNVSPPAKQQPTAGNSTAFSLSEVEKGLVGGITCKRMAVLVDKFGVDFPLNTAARKRLADDGADDNLLATISASKRSL